MASFSTRTVLLAIALAVAGTAVVAAAGGYLLTAATEQWQPVPPIVAPAASPGASPGDALVLFSGNDLSEWVASKDKGPAGWRVADGVLTVDKASGNIETRRSFRNFQLHLEWRVPANITGSGQ